MEKIEENEKTNRAIITVVGNDQTGIIATVSTAIAEENINILDISQAFSSGFFILILIVDMSNSHSNLKQVQDKLKLIGDKVGLSIKMQHEDVFKVMHRI